jgi:lipopolysaccharide exporter
VTDQTNNSNSDPAVDLAVKAVKSTAWLFALRAVQVGGLVLRLIIVARLLSPTDFGLFGIAILSLAVLDIFSEPGFKQAIIHKSDNTEPFLNTAWTLGIIRSLVIAGILVLAAPFIAVLFKSPEAAGLIRAIGFVTIINSLVNISVVSFEKELEFSKFFQYQFLAFITETILAIIIAFFYRSPWALVIAVLGGNLVRCIMSYRVDPYRPRFEFNFQKARELWGFGRWILGSNILLFLITQGDDLIVGSVIGAAALGFYQLAYRISNIPQTEYTHLISRVAFPTYAKLKDNLERLGRTYCRLLNFSIFVCVPSAVLICSLGADFTRIFLGAKWMQMVPALQILSLYGLLRSLESSTGALFMAIGKPHIRTKLQLLQLVLLAAVIYPLTARFGFIGAAFAVTFYAVATNPIAVALALKITHSSFATTRSAILYSLAASACMISPYLILKHLIDYQIDLLTFVISGIIAICIYLVLIYLFIIKPAYRDWQSFYTFIKSFVKDLKPDAQAVNAEETTAG